MPITKITKEEFEMMDRWRKWYAHNDSSHPINTNFAPSENILYEWEYRKNEFLYNLFGKELIIRKNIEMNKDPDKLYDEIYHCLLYGTGNIGRKDRNGHEFSSALKEFASTYFLGEYRYKIYSLLNASSLLKNIYEGDTFELPLENGKTFKVQHGCKISKALGKIANLFDLPGYEDFRICQSYILNHKKIEGELVLSIHPLDYMTMSDNTYGWDSCMSWTEEGSYRQGTVEMMNSENVIVAYINGGEMRIGDHFWNDKKWRQLFIVDPKVLASIRSYPYSDEDLTVEVMNWLKELAATNLGWEYDEITPLSADKRFTLNHLPEDKQKFKLTFNTNNMYNDMNGGDDHLICLNSKNITVDDIKTDRIFASTNFSLNIYYSGLSQCMVCGEYDIAVNDESCLACTACQERYYCDCCEQYTGNIYVVDDMDLCSECYTDRTAPCEICDEVHLKNNLKEIKIIPRVEPKYRNKIIKDYLKVRSGSYIKAEDITDDIELNYYTDYNAYVCEDEIEDWIEKYLKENERPHMRSWEWENNTMCVYFDQLNEDYFKEDFNDLHKFEDAEKFINVFGRYTINYHTIRLSNFIEYC